MSLHVFFLVCCRVFSSHAVDGMERSELKKHVVRSRGAGSACVLSTFLQSSDDLTSLSMPVGYKVLKSVIDFIYTDEFSTNGKGMYRRGRALMGGGAVCAEWFSECKETPCLC